MKKCATLMLSVKGITQERERQEIKVDQTCIRTIKESQRLHAQSHHHRKKAENETNRCHKMAVSLSDHMDSVT